MALFSHPEGNIPFGGTGDHLIKQNKPGTERQISSCHSSMQSLDFNKAMKVLWTLSGNSVARDLHSWPCWVLHSAVSLNSLVLRSRILGYLNPLCSRSFLGSPAVMPILLGLLCWSCSKEVSYQSVYFSLASSSFSSHMSGIAQGLALNSRVLVQHLGFHRQSWIGLRV